MTTSYTIVLEYQFESLNITMRQHWAVRKKRQEELFAAVECAAEQPIPTFKGKSVVTITRQWGKRGRAFDPDNLVGSVKPLIDCLKKPKGRQKSGLGIIPDDTPEDIELRVKQEKSPDGVHRAIIEIDTQGTKDV